MTPPDSADSADLEKGLCTSRVAETKQERLRGATVSSNSSTVKSMSSIEKKSAAASSNASISESKAQLTEHDAEDKKMEWWRATVVMIAETISLGILSLPVAVSHIGLLPAGILIFGFGLITTYTGFEVHRFKARNPEVKSFAQAAGEIAGPIGRWIVEMMQLAFIIFIMAGHITLFRSMVFKLSEGKDFQICGVWLTLIALVIMMFCTLPRTLKTNSKLSICSCISIFAATCITIGSVIANSKDGSVHADTVVTWVSGTTFPLAAAAVSNILVSYTGHIAYFTIIEEMKVPSDFPKALFTTNIVTITMYTLASLVIYAFAGKDVKSPALDSTDATVGISAYVFAIPTILVAGVICALVAAKRFYNIVWNERPAVMEEKSFRARGSWVGIVAALWIVSWVVANVIPWFSSLLAIIGAIVGTWLCLGFPAIFWFHGTRGGGRKGWKKRTLMLINAILLVMCVGAMGLGLYGSIFEMRSHTESARPFPCRVPA